MKNFFLSDIPDIPDDIRHLRLLQVADFSSNPIPKLPAGFSQLRSLTILGLNDMSLTSLPADFGWWVKIARYWINNEFIYIWVIYAYICLTYSLYLPLLPCHIPSRLLLCAKERALERTWESIKCATSDMLVMAFITWIHGLRWFYSVLLPF